MNSHGTRSHHYPQAIRLGIARYFKSERLFRGKRWQPFSCAKRAERVCETEPVDGTKLEIFEGDFVEVLLGIDNVP